jgi:hypothetical protein
MLFINKRSMGHIAHLSHKKDMAHFKKNIELPLLNDNVFKA